MVTGETLLLLLLPCSGAEKRLRQQGALLFNGVVTYQVSMDLRPVLYRWPVQIQGHQQSEVGHEGWR